jgi:hypothetical protein
VRVGFISVNKSNHPIQPPSVVMNTRDNMFYIESFQISKKITPIYTAYDLEWDRGLLDVILKKKIPLFLPRAEVDIVSNMPQILRHIISLEKWSLLAWLKIQLRSGIKAGLVRGNWFYIELSFFHLLRIREKGNTENISVGKAKKKERTLTWENNIEIDLEGRECGNIDKFIWLRIWFCNRLL